MILFLSFMLSLCSISYQFIIARILMQFSNDEVLSQSITLGFYLVAMGLGSQFVGTVKTKNTRRLLFVVENMLSLTGLILGPLIYGLYVLISVFFFNFVGNLSNLTHGTEKVFIFQFITCFVGFLTGMELPLLFKIQENSPHSVSFSKILGANYMGALAGAFLLPLYLTPRLDVTRSSIIISIINFIAVIILCLQQRNIINRLISSIAASAIFFSLAFTVLNYSDEVEQIYLKTFYLETKLPVFSLAAVKNLIFAMHGFNDVERYQTPYQIVDIIPERFMKGDKAEGDFSLYLNMQPQFSRSSQKSYHESMVEGAFILSHKVPKKVLVLGAGDGLLVAELLKHPEIEKIVLVEIDPFMISLANEYSDIKKLNQAALFDPRVQVVIGDAFNFTRRNNKSFDAAFVDFPFPVSYELGKLFSVEFYSSLKSVLAADGYFIADIPIWRTYDTSFTTPSLTPQDIVLSSLQLAELKNNLIYGPYEPFIFVSMSAHPLKFNYEKISPWISGRTLLNLSPLSDVQKNAKIHTSNANSIFKPKRFLW